MFFPLPFPCFSQLYHLISEVILVEEVVKGPLPNGEVLGQDREVCQVMAELRSGGCL